MFSTIEAARELLGSAGKEAMAMNRETSRYDRSNVPESSWPDGTPVSNWSQAVAALSRTGVLRPSHETDRAINNVEPTLAKAA